MIEIIPLEEYPHYAPILAYWAYREWYCNRNIEFEIVVKSYQRRTRSNVLPETFIAIHNGVPAGMASLKEIDLWSRKDIGPWLSSLYVEPEYRRMGTGRLLIEKKKETAGKSGFRKLYLFLGGPEKNLLEKYYSKNGWNFFADDVDNEGVATKILTFDLIRT